MDKLEITVDGKTIEIEVERKRRKTLVLRVFPESGRALLSLPVNTPVAYARAFLEKRLPWLEDKLREVLPHVKKYSFDNGEVFYYQGLPLTFRIDAGARSQVLIQGQELVLYQKEELDRENRRRLLDDFFRSRTAVLGALALEHFFVLFSAFLGEGAMPELKVRRMTSRWGSCLPQKRKITLSSRLAHLPPECFDYIVAHEICHLKQADHSPLFWDLLAKVMPDWRTRRQQLNKAALYMLYQ